jgi:16S rRNA (cytosine1402-N4)-methyltransferase
MPAEVIDFLDVQPGGTYVDCTAGAGGHSALIAERLSGGRLIALDQDPSAVQMASERLAPWPHCEVVHTRYDALAEVLASRGIAGVDGILLDAGVSSMQLDQAERGFSLDREGPLDMRMNPTTGLSAAQWIASTDEATVSEALRQYGDVGPARRIAKRIKARSLSGQMNRTTDLVAAVCEGLDFVNRVPDEVRTVFQAIRIAVNDELQVLETALRRGIDQLNVDGRFVVLAFHGTEDSVVKGVFRDVSRKHIERYPDGRTKSQTPPLARLLTRKPVTPTAEEVSQNPRAKSARLRAVTRIESRRAV